MNTNSNTYTVVYTSIIVVVVAAILALVAMTLKPMQVANVKAETISQMLIAAQYGTSEEFAELSNNEILAKYSENISEAFTVNASGVKVADLNTEVEKIELIDELKPQDKAIKSGDDLTLPVYIFKSGMTVVPCYGAGLWGPVWGYLAFEGNDATFAGAYFDHQGETPGLGAKIKDEAWFREQFVGKTIVFDSTPLFEIVKGGAPEGAQNAVDGISGATMTVKGLDEAINVWMEAYKPYFEQVKAAVAVSTDNTTVEE